MATPLIMIVGPLLIGSLMSYFLFGIYAVQLYYYFSNYGTSDRGLILTVVYGVTLVEVLQLFFSSHTTWEVLAKGYAQPELLATPPWSSAGLPSLNGFVALLVQFFFAWRIFNLSQNLPGKLFAFAILLLALTQAGAALSVSIQFGLLGNDYSKLDALNSTVKLWLAGSFACDLLISAGMVVLLLYRKEKTSYETSRNIINLLITNTIENGIVTTACALVELICYSVDHENWLHIMFEYMLGRLYANVLLATLNGRAKLRTNETTVELTSTQRAAGATRGQYTWQNVSSTGYTSNHGQLKSYPVVSVATEVKVDTEIDIFSTKAHGGSHPTHAT